MESFSAELTKEALAPVLQRMLPAIGSGAGLGSLVGATGGALYGAGKPYLEARREGLGRREAVGQGLSGLFGGAVRGAVLGAGLGAGGLGTAAALKRTPAFASKLTEAPGIIGASARFGQRQLHGLTRWEPEAGLESIRGGAWEAKKRVRSATEALQKARLAGEDTTKLEKGLQKAKAYQPIAEEAQRMGLTSIPGYARSFVQTPVKTVTTGLKEQWGGMDPLGRAMIYGLPAAGIVGALASKGEPGGPGHLENVGEQLGTAMGFGMAPVPLGTQLALSSLLGAVGKRTGRAIQRDKGTPPPSPPGPVEPGGGMTQPEEYIYTNRATGNI
jgi:hypothetical protein